MPNNTNKNKTSSTHKSSKFNSDGTSTRVLCSLQPAKTKPYDLSLMTGNNTEGKGGDQK